MTTQDEAEHLAYNELNSELIGALKTIRGLNKKYFRRELTKVDAASYYFARAVIFHSVARDPSDALREQTLRQKARKCEEIAMEFMIS